jgi:nitroreductase/NAD-dependent dihydropyrimidine dehydrogenase PreA subunit
MMDNAEHIILIDQDSCIQCGACAALCTGHVFSHTDQLVELVAPEECWLCGHCVAACPTDAIAHNGFPLDACPELDPAALPLLDSLVTALRERRSARAFQVRPVPRDVVRELVDIARWAPSAANDQPVDWLAFDDPDRIAELSAQAVAVYDRTVRLLRNRWLRPFLRLTLGSETLKAGLESAEGFEELVQRHANGEDPIFRHAPVVLVAHVPSSDYFWRDDAVYAAYNLMLAAQRMGLGTCPIGYFHIALDRSTDLQRELGLPEGHRAEVTLTLGYPEFGFQRVLPRRQPRLVWSAAPE